MLNSLNNLAITATKGSMASFIGGGWDYLQTKLANGKRDTNCKFYYNEAGGSVYQVIGRYLANGYVSGLSDMLKNNFNSWMDGKKKKSVNGEKWVARELEKQTKESQEYGKMMVKSISGDKEVAIYALDDWGGIATEALMLSIETDQNITIKQEFPQYKSIAVPNKKDYFKRDTWINGSDSVSYREQAPEITRNEVTTHSLVWYDTTALITINSEKNLISTKVQGRDYSRKELVSNGDINFTVSGQITSGLPDLYPVSEIEKFIRVMQYKGVVRVNNQVLDQFGITHIVITDFTITPKEGYKSLQQYTFRAIGLQPESEIEITEDTISILPQNVKVSEDGNAWVDMFKDELDGLKGMAKDAFSQGVALSTGLLDKVL